MSTTLLTDRTARREWFLVDATGQTLGRLATRIATVLMGKHKPTYTPHVDTGDFVVVVNAEKIRLSGRKAEKKVYKRYSGYPGGLKEVPYAKVAAKTPEKIVYLAVKRMLPANRLTRLQIRKLHVYRGPAHPHAAQQLKPFPSRVI
jgi:large subunit ribosomal protein L13